MKIYSILILSLAVAVAFPQVAGAKLSMTPQALGFVEATLDSCVKVDPDSAAKYKEMGKAFVVDATKEELEKARVILRDFKREVMYNSLVLGPKRMVLACLLAGMLASPALTQSPEGKE